MNSFIAWFVTHPWIWITFVAFGITFGTVAYLILLERKTASWVQDRLGPNRVGFEVLAFLPGMKFLKGKFGGFGQPMADGLKFFTKEDYRPKGADKVLFTVAPMLMITIVIISAAVIPWGGIKQATHTFLIAAGTDPTVQVPHLIPANATAFHIDNVQQDPNPGNTLQFQYITVTYDYPFQIANLNIGVLYVLAVLSLAVYGVVIGGWASNNKYSFLGGLRATANMISYEIPLGLAILCIVLLYGSLDLNTIVDRQCHYWLGFIPAWNCFCQPLPFLMFLICIHAEANRAPFDLAEAEQELVGGYHTEYSSMRFALFFLGEYAGMLTTSAVCVALFFGGWHLPWLELIPGVGPYLGAGINSAHPEITNNLIGCFVRAGVFFGKTIGIIFVFMWVRWSLPRFRFDQLMMLAWRAMIPMALGMLMATTIVLYLFRDDLTPDLHLNGYLALALLVANLIVLVATLIISQLVPAAPATNRKIRIPGSRFASPEIGGSH
ncbi:MAG TPA: complex I subunit 1 family protein [Tepidisphaeraceae bacterium]|jgi:NADH-quinone oxidoreductase subunit H|nr:complex I subunit 1 family protein [Tepidisphaeraceae bacterium]